MPKVVSHGHPPQPVLLFLDFHYTALLSNATPKDNCEQCMRLLASCSKKQCTFQTHILFSAVPSPRWRTQCTAMSRKFTASLTVFARCRPLESRISKELHTDSMSGIVRENLIAKDVFVIAEDSESLKVGLEGLMKGRRKSEKEKDKGITLRWRRGFPENADRTLHGVRSLPGRRCKFCLAVVLFLIAILCTHIVTNTHTKHAYMLARALKIHIADLISVLATIFSA